MGLFLILWSFALSVAVVWYTLTPVIVAAAFVVAGVLAWRFRYPPIPMDEAADERLPFKKRRFALPIFFILYAVAGLGLFFWMGVSTSLQTPWQGIAPWYLPVFFLLTAILGFFLFAPYRVKTVLALIIIHSLLQHLYLPASHVLPWGGDVWRHIAVEEKLSHGEIQPPGLPEALIIPHKYTYGQLWGVSAALSMVTRLPLTEVNRWLMPILWSIALPLLLFQLGVLLFWSRRWALALAALPAISFPFQALGALTLPVSLGFLTFLFVLLLWLRYLHTGEKRIKALALALAGIMAFGYVLYFVLIWTVIGASVVLRNKKQIFSLFGVLIFPVIDMVVGGSRLPTAWNVVTALKLFVGQFSGWYYASAIRPHDIVTGNIFFNHTPSYAFVENFFTVWRWWIIPVMLALWGGAAVGFFKAPKTRGWQVLQCCSVAVFGGYVIGWYVLEGDRLFTRRLDLTLAFLAMIFFLQGLIIFGKKIQQAKYKKVFVSCFMLLASWFTTATYASGPDLRVVSGEEYAAAQSAWASEQAHSPPYCVLADTWVLLPLEAISAGKIVGGGFPIDRQFGQPERMRLYEAMRADTEENWGEEAMHLTGATQCLGLP